MIVVTKLTKEVHEGTELWDFAGTANGKPFSGSCDRRGEYDFAECPEEYEDDTEPLMIAVGTKIEESESE